jgi:hypothetical protein
MAGVDGHLQKAQKALCLAEDADTSTVVAGLMDAVVLATPAAKKWLHACAHMSVVSRSQTVTTAEAAPVAKKIFRRGFHVARLLRAVLALGRPLSQGRALFPEVESLLASVADALRLLAVELREPGPKKYLRELGLLPDGSALEGFKMPSDRKEAPGQKKQEQRGSDNYFEKSVSAAFSRWTEEEPDPALDALDGKDESHDATWREAQGEGQAVAKEVSFLVCHRPIVCCCVECSDLRVWSMSRSAR